MALADLTDPTAVLAAVREFDSLGRQAFLSKYGFGPARDYFLEFNGRRYDSKAIVGAAHGVQTGTQLRASEFSGGDATVAAHLEALGFKVTGGTSEAWHWAEGAITTRSEVKERYGGTIYGGIEPSRTSPNILIYTDPEQGAANGYNYDGWDLHDPNVFYYTGEGRTGDQELKDGNRAILDQQETGRTLRLFEAVDKGKRPGGKRQRYLGSFRIDDTDPYRFEPAPDKDGKPRRVLVFRLVREGARAMTTPPAPPRTVPTPEQSGPSARANGSNETYATPNGPTTRTDADEAGADIQIVASENNTATEYEVQPRSGKIAQRDEAQIVAQFEGWLRGRKHEVQRVRIRIPGERHELITDTYDSTEAVLYEAKSGVDRATIRLGVGQILDYLRFLPEARGRLLLPEEPSADLKQLVKSCALGLAYRRLGSWIIEP